jgi:hypothetical protein
MLKRFEVFDHIVFFLIAQVQVHECVVVINNIQEGCKSSVVKETTFLVRPEAFQRCSPVHSVRKGLLCVNAATEVRNRAVVLK